MTNFYIEKLKIKWYGPLGFDNEVSLKPGVNLLLGKNGSGKTRTLKMLDQAAKNQAGYSPANFPKEIGNILDDQLVYISIKEGENVQTISFNKNGSWQNTERLQNRTKFISSDRSVKGQLTTSNPLKTFSEFAISDQISEINIVDEFNKAVISELIRVIEEKGQEIPELTKNIEDHYQVGLVDFEKNIKIDFNHEPVAFFLDSKDREVQLTDLSDGEKEYLYFLAFLYRVHGEKEKIILIDEPELHLHGSQIRKLCELISLLSKENQIIIATHSGDILQYFLSQSNVILLAKNEIKNIKVNEDVKQVVDELGLPIDPSFFTSHWVCAENDPNSHLKGGNAPKTDEVLGWIFQKDIKKRFWSFGSLKSKAEARIEVLRDINKEESPIKLSVLFDGDKQVNTSDTFPPNLSENQPVNGIFSLPFWELENIFLIPEILDKTTLEKKGRSGNDQVWDIVQTNKEKLFESVLGTLIKNAVLSKFKYENFPKGTIEELVLWKEKANQISIDKDVLKLKYDAVVSSKNWAWLPGKEVISLVLTNNPDFWVKIRELVESKNFEKIITSIPTIKSLIEEINKND